MPSNMKELNRGQVCISKQALIKIQYGNDVSGQNLVDLCLIFKNVTSGTACGLESAVKLMIWTI